jgi:hypothetical protein
MNEHTQSWKINPPTPEYLKSLSWAEFTAELGRQLAIARRQVEGTCAVCGTPFTGTTKRKYCSNRCAVRAYRRAHYKVAVDAEGT